MPEAVDGCVEPAKGPIGGGEEGAPEMMPAQRGKEEHIMVAEVGKAAPDFEASGFIDGGFKNIKLADYKGKWIVLCFYPGDFTFV